MRVEVTIKVKTGNKKDEHVQHLVEVDIDDDLFDTLHNSEETDIIWNEVDEEIMKIVSWDFEIIEERKIGVVKL